MQDYNDYDYEVYNLPLIIGLFELTLIIKGKYVAKGSGRLGGMSGYDKCTCSIDPTVLTSAPVRVAATFMYTDVRN